MGGDDSQKLLHWRGPTPPPARKPPAQLRINKVTEPSVGISRAPPFLAMASATARLGHFWKVQVGHSWRAPKFWLMAPSAMGKHLPTVRCTTPAPPSSGACHDGIRAHKCLACSRSNA